MRPLITYPVMWTILLIIWVLLGRAYSPGWILLGMVFATLGTVLMGALRLDEPSIRRPKAAIQLLGMVSMDIIRSNIAVARIIGRPNRPVTSGFLRIPIAIESPTALAILAVIITSTPGTLWFSYDRRDGTLIVHILDLVDEVVWLKQIKGRYERMLIAIFQ